MLAKLHHRSFFILFSLILIACERQPVTFSHTDITGNTQIGSTFNLLDSQGKVRQLTDFRGKVVLLFFGYTQCPDVCPTTLAELRQVMQALGSDADKLQVIFISLDPERDTSTLLDQYISSFDRRFIALRPRTTEELKQTIEHFKIYAARISGTQTNHYTIDHSVGSYVFDTRGRIRLFIRHGQDIALLIQDIRLLMNETS